MQPHYPLGGDNHHHSMVHQDLVVWQKRNLYIRIALLAVLLILLFFVVKNRFGQPCESDIRISNVETGELISCEEALDYYAERELGFDLFEEFGNQIDIADTTFPLLSGQSLE